MNLVSEIRREHCRSKAVPLPRELAVSRDASEQFRLYRAFNFRRQPRLFCKSGVIEQSFSLEPSQFMATIA